MTTKFIELHDTDNVPYMINTAWVMFFYGTEDGGCVLLLGMPNTNDAPITRTFVESYEAIKRML